VKRRRCICLCASNWDWQKAAKKKKQPTSRALKNNTIRPTGERGGGVKGNSNVPVPFLQRKPKKKNCTRKQSDMTKTEARDWLTAPQNPTTERAEAHEDTRATEQAGRRKRQSKAKPSVARSCRVLPGKLNLVSPPFSSNDVP